MKIEYTTILEELIDYSNEIIDGTQVACKKHKLACKRFLNDLDRMENDDGFPYYWNEERARKIAKWYLYTKHSKGVLAGQPIKLTSFQKFIVCNIEAWLHIDTDLRRFKNGYIQIARKNAKSQIEAGMASYEIAGRGTQAAEVYTLGVEREQSKIVFDEVDLMITKHIRKRLKITQKEIKHKKSKSFIKHLSKKAGKTGDGKNPQMAIVDEYHAHPDSKMYDVMESGMGSRDEPLLMIITTSGEDFEDKPCYEEYQYCSNILEGILINDEYYIIICELEEGDDPKDEKVWIKANPILATYEKGMEYLRRRCKKAYDSGIASKIKDFRTKNCNIWVKDGGDKKYINIDWWKKCKKNINILEKFRGCDCYAAFDLSKTGDLTSISFEFPFLEDGIRKYALYSHSFIPAAVMQEKMKTDKVPYDYWIEKGWLTATEANDGLIVDYWGMIALLEKIEEEFDLNILDIGYDGHNANMLVAEMENRGYSAIEIPQSCRKLDEPTVNFRDEMRVGHLVHDGNKLLSWAFNNAEVDTNSFGEIKLSKKSRFKRIDPAATCIFTHKLAMQYWNRPDYSKYLTDSYLDKLYGANKET